MRELEGKGAVITGGASGIGLATAKALARRGVRLLIADIEAGAVDRAAASLAREGASVETVVCDVGDRAAVERLASDAFRSLGGVHIVFNNAGVAVGGPIVEMKHDDWEWVLRVNLWGAIHGVESFAQRLIDQGEGGQLLFTSSFAGLVPNVGLGPYCVSKYGVVALSEVLRRELRAHDIGVSVLCPMRVSTAIETSQRNRPDDFGGPEASPPVLDQGPANDALAGAVLEADDVAEQVVDAIVSNRPYILPHRESRSPIRRRFERIDQSFDA